MTTAPANAGQARAPDADRAELAKLVRWAIRIALVLARMHGQWHRREALISDALYALHGALRTFDESKGKLLPFLRIRITGELRDTIKRERRRAAWEVALDDADGALPAGTEDDPAALSFAAGVEAFVACCTAAELHASAEEQYLRREAVTVLHQELEKLSPDARRQLYLRYWQRLTWDDVAAALGISERTARDHDATFRKALKSALLAREAPPRPRSGKP